MKKMILTALSLALLVSCNIFKQSTSSQSNGQLPSTFAETNSIMENNSFPESAAPSVQDSSASIKEFSNSSIKQLIPIQITINESAYRAFFYDTETAHFLIGQLPLTLELSDYGGKEKVTELPFSFPLETTEKPDVINNGDIYLWSGNRLVFFYTSFSNSYDGYIPIGFLENPENWRKAIESEKVTMTVSLWKD